MIARQIMIAKSLCVLCCAFGLVFPAWSAEPEHEGKSLSEWLKLYQNADDGSPDERKATTAVRAVGTNALPMLVTWVASNDLDEQFLAKNGFQILGTAAQPAVESLGKMLVSTNPVISLIAGECLGHIGAPALPELLAGLTNRQFRVGTAAALAIVELRTNASPAIPILLQHLQHPNHFYRERAADALGNLGIEPETVIPALARLLKDDSKAARYLALRGLENFESRAGPAVPAITDLLADPEESIRETATNVLRRITPEVLTNPPSH